MTRNTLAKERRFQTPDGPSRRFAARWLVVVGSWACLFTVVGRAQEDRTADDRRPNFVIILADDAGWRDVGYHGSEIATPHLDRLAKSGAQFDQFYVCPTCSPTRAAVMMGRPPSRCGILTPVGGKHSAESLPRGSATLPELLRREGYATAISGKWHLGERPEIGPRQFGFERSYGSLRGQIDPLTHAYKTGERTWHRNDVYFDETGHATDLITNEAIAFVHEQAGSAAPFFLYVAYSVPHYPLSEPEKWVEPYRETIANESRRLYAASMTHMDDSVGQVVAALQQTGQVENTVVVFLSDNGGQRSWTDTSVQYEGRYPPHDRLGDNRPLRGWKTSLYEGGIRVPALMVWPGKLLSQKLTQVCCAWDLYPTLAFLADVAIPAAAEIEGVNLWPSLTDNEQVPENRLLYWRTPGAMALRKGPWKLIHLGKTLSQGKDELYHLDKDPHEENECGAIHPEVLAMMREELNKQRVRD